MSANPHTSPLAVALFEAFARNGGNRPNDHFDRNAAEQWMQQALDECLPKPAAAQEAVRQPDGYHYRYPDLYGTDTCIRKNNGEEVNGSKPVEAVPYWYAPATAAPGIDLAALRARVVSAIERITSGAASMRIPADMTDPDLVLGDVLCLLDSLGPQTDASPKGGSEARAYTTGHCENHKKPGGCPLHNLQCGYPQCDRKPASDAEVRDGE